MPVQFYLKIIRIGMISITCPSPIKIYAANIFLLAIQVDVCVCDNSCCFFVVTNMKLLENSVLARFVGPLFVVFAFFLEHIRLEDDIR